MISKPYSTIGVSIWSISHSSPFSYLEHLALYEMQNLMPFQGPKCLAEHNGWIEVQRKHQNMHWKILGAIVSLKLITRLTYPYTHRWQHILQQYTKCVLQKNSTDCSIHLYLFDSLIKNLLSCLKIWHKGKIWWVVLWKQFAFIVKWIVQKKYKTMAPLWCRILRTQKVL